MMSQQPPTTRKPADVPPLAAPLKSVRPAVQGFVLGTVFAALALMLFIWLADEILASQTQKWDAATVRFVLQHVSPPVHLFMAAITLLASGESQAVVVGAAALYFLWRGRFWPEGVTMLIAGFGGMLLDEGLKRLFHRPRPEAIFYPLGYSFPSGHAFSAVVIYGILAYWLSRAMEMRWRFLIWAVAVFLMAIVGLSRICLGQHYPTDVAGGYLAGSCWLWACITWLTMLRRAHPAVAPPPIGFTNE